MTFENLFEYTASQYEVVLGVLSLTAAVFAAALDLARVNIELFDHAPYRRCQHRLRGGRRALGGRVGVVLPGRDRHRAQEDRAPRGLRVLRTTLGIVGTLRLGPRGARLGLRGAFLGPIVERIQHDISYTATASDVPVGEYVVMTFVSKFALSERVFEKLTLMLGEDDQWQVVGYFLKQA